MQRSQFEALWFVSASLTARLAPLRVHALMVHRRHRSRTAISVQNQIDLSGSQLKQTERTAQEQEEEIIIDNRS